MLIKWNKDQILRIQKADGFVYLDEVANLLILTMYHACIHIRKNAHK